MFLQQVDDSINTQRSWMKDYKFHLVTSVKQLSKLIDLCVQRKLYAIDVETTGVDNRIYPDEFFEDNKKTRHGIRTIDKIAGVCMSFDGENGYYVPLSHEPEESGNLPWDPAWDEFERLIYSDARAIVHNGKFDFEFLYPVTGKEYWKITEHEDTFLMSKVINPLKGSPNGLKPLTKIHFDVDMIELDDLFTDEMKALLKKEKMGYNFAVLHPKEGLEYGCSDGIFTYKLMPILREKLTESDITIYNLEKSFCNVLRKLERNRVHADVDRLRQLETECTAEMIRVGDAVRNYIEKRTRSTGKWNTLNIGSVDQLSAALITDLEEGLKLKPTKEMIEEAGGNGSSGGGDDDDDDDNHGETAIEKYSLKDTAITSLHKAYGEKHFIEFDTDDPDGKKKKNSIFELILEYRHYVKMLGSFVTPLLSAVDKYGDVRPNFNQMGTDTARLSSKAGKIEDGYSGINFQGIPRDSDEDKPELFKQIRTVITPRLGWMLLKLDFAGEELRVVTNLSGDKIWTKSFLYEDGDVHSITARILFGKDEVNKDERNRGKRSNFAFIYGGGAGAIQRNVGCSMEDAQRHMDNLRHGVPELMGYVDYQKSFAKKFKCIYTAFGRRVPILNIDSPIRKLRSKAERCAINYTIQSTSADVLKYAMCFVDKNIRQNGWEDRVRYVLTVHDEVVFEVKPEHLMEITRKLDEWMTCIWKLPKMHGREWVVPLLTEPGIDVHWRARYDYFMMVDGVPAKKNDITEDGTFQGKLKSSQYFADGRIYQKIPDFLIPYIRRIPPGQTDILALPEPIENLPESAVDEKEQIVALPLEESHPLLEELTSATQETKTSVFDDLDLSDISLNNSNVILSESNLEANPSEGGLEDFSTTSDSVPKLAEKSESNSISEETKESTIKETSIDESSVLRWTIRCHLNEVTARKLHALCILAEGETPLRVITLDGEILISENVGARVNREEFLCLARLMGLGS